MSTPKGMVKLRMVLRKWVVRYFDVTGNTLLDESEPADYQTALNIYDSKVEFGGWLKEQGL